MAVLTKVLSCVLYLSLVVIVITSAKSTKKSKKDTTTGQHDDNRNPNSRGFTNFNFTIPALPTIPTLPGFVYSAPNNNTRDESPFDFTSPLQSLAATVTNLGTLGASGHMGNTRLAFISKNLILGFVISILTVVFLISGSAFFICNLTDCGNLFGGLKKGGGEGGIDGFSLGGGGNVGASSGAYNTFTDRNGYQNFRPVLQSLDEALKKYN